MNRENELFLVVFISIILILILIVSLNYERIDSFIEKNVEDYGYPAIFIFSFLSDTIDQPIVPEVPTILGVGYRLDPLNVFLTAALGISLIGFINFRIGRRVFSKKIRNLCTTKKYANYCRFFYKYGKWSLLMAALTPLPYVTFVWLSGAFGMKFKTFLVFGTLAKAFRLGFILMVYLLFNVLIF